MDDDRKEIESLRESLRRSSERIAELSAELRSAREALARQNAEKELLAARLDEGELERLAERNRVLEVRLARLHSLGPVRIYNRLRGVPPVSWIVARRTRGYRAELAERERG